MLLDLSHSPYLENSMAVQFSSFIAMAQSVGFNVIIANDFYNIASYDVVMFHLPQSPFSSYDVSVVRNYLDGGGILMVFAEWGDAWPTWVHADRAWSLA